MYDIILYDITLVLRQALFHYSLMYYMILLNTIVYYIYVNNVNRKSYRIKSRSSQDSDHVFGSLVLK